MALTSPPESQGAPRRVVLIDLDWQEADLVPELLRRPEMHVRLVAGDNEENAGWRVAELCGLPRTLSLADLTREIFDLALVGERSGRRTQVERLLTALGTPIATPRSFMDPAAPSHGHARPSQPPGLTGSAHERVELDGLDAALERALPDLSSPVAVEETKPARSERELPGPDDAVALRLVLTRWAEATGTSAAVLHAGVGAVVVPLCRVGEEDPLLDALVHLSLSLETPHVVSRLDGPDRGMAWGAWPFRTRGRRGVVAAARFDAIEGRAHWEEAVQELRVSWEKHERTRDAGAPVETPPNPPPWLSPEAFDARLALAVECNDNEGTPFAVHRMRFDETPECLDAYCETLPTRLREGDAIARPTRREVLLLHRGAPSAFAHVRRRMVALWEETWRLSSRRVPAPPIVEERVDLVGREDAEPFAATARRWLGVP